MVTASVPQSASGVGTLFETRNLTGIVIVGSIAAVGVALSLTVAAILNSVLGREGGGVSRLDMAVLALGAGLAAIGASRVFGPGISGALAIGSVVVIGIAIIQMVFGPQSTATPSSFNHIVRDDGLTSAAPSLFGQDATSNPPRRVGSTTRDGQVRDIGHDPAVVGGGFR